MMRALLAKFVEGRDAPDAAPGAAPVAAPADAPATAPDAPIDGPSVFALWLFAAEHWQQARQQSLPPPGVLSAHSIDINNLSEADAEARRRPAHARPGTGSTGSTSSGHSAHPTHTTHCTAPHPTAVPASTILPTGWQREPLLPIPTE